MTSTPRAAGGATTQTAARLLVVMDKLGDVPTPPDLLKVPNTVRVVRALSRLVKLDFWLRNPDYLADELLNDVEIAGLDPSVALPHVARMLEGSAPVLHLYPMQRYKYGAWELPDNAVAILKLHGFATTKRAKEMDAAASSKARRDYFLLPEGRDALQRMREDVEQLSWYDAQADAIALLDLPGTGLAAKQRQYQQPEYAATPVGATIEPILIRVRSRFERVSALHGLGSVAEHTPDHSENGRNSK
ncbi:hypothetical protein ACFVSK_04130 [Cellulosimicrobium cellulans]|uniref:hypothetical protein n=1 Tax=Cellulosimicrobium cellulans TaxID=1710 RepID=UPI0036E1013B